MDIRQIVIMPIFTTNHNHCVPWRWASMAITRRWWLARCYSFFPCKGLYKKDEEKIKLVSCIKFIRGCSSPSKCIIQTNNQMKKAYLYSRCTDHCSRLPHYYLLIFHSHQRQIGASQQALHYGLPELLAPHLLKLEISMYVKLQKASGT